MRDEMKRTMFELFGVGSEDDKVLAAGGKKPVAKPEPVKTTPVQAPVQPVVKAKAASYLAAGTSLEGTLRSDGDLEITGGTTLEEKAQISGGLVTGTLAVVKGAVIRGGVEIKAFSGPAKQEHKQEHKAN